MQPYTTLFKLSTLAASCALLLAACGGGGGGGTAASGGGAASSANAAVYSGPIGGFGSVVVNGVRFSTVGSTLVDDDGNTVDLSKLRMGMTVRVAGTADDTALTGSATKLEVVHGTRGVVTAVNVPLGTLTVLGQTIKVDSNTAYQGVANLAALAALSSPAVEIYGAQQADGSLLATLVEVKTLTALSLFGKVSNLTPTSFQVGPVGGPYLTVNYNAAQVSGTLANGARVKVKAGTGALSGSTLNATSVQVLGAGWAWGSSATGLLIKVKGVVDAAPVGGVLTLSGTPVNLATATIEGGTLASITAGSFIEVKGSWDGTSLQATKVELEGAREARVGGRNELYGVVSSVSGSTAVVDGVSVDLSTAVFSRGSLAQVAVGSYVEVKGNMVGSTLQAKKVELKTGAAAAGVAFEQFGQVTDYVSVSSFKLNGIQVDASKAVLEGGSTIANGTYLEIKGTQDANGVLLASKVEIKSRAQ